MTVITLSAVAGPDGGWHLDIPVGAAGEYQVAVTPRPAGGDPGRPPTPEELGWPPGYFENVIGSIDDPAFMRYPQGEFEEREPLE